MRLSSWVLNGVFFALKAACVLLMIGAPVAGVWIASSLAAFSNRAAWLPVAAGLLLFPGLPLAWEAWAASRARGRVKRLRVLTFSDRMILRTLVVNTVFLAVLLSAFPTRAFVALSTRGDWMLEGRSGESVERTRRVLLKGAAGLEWLYRAAHQNPYRQDRKDDEHPTPSPTAAPSHAVPASPSSDATAHPSGSAEPIPSPVSKTEQAAEPRYPFAATLHPLVMNMPAEVETSPASVAKYIAEREKDPFQRVKALHDWVADRIAYDAPAYLEHRVPPEDRDADAVFRSRVAVCAGYAKLLALLGTVTGDEIRYVVGDARTESNPMEGEGHAWNAARIGDSWYLIDPTWDAGGLTGGAFKKSYASDFLFAPPDQFVITHFPDEAEWQLLAAPVSRVDFFRRPVLSPAFFAHGLELLEPDRSQVSTGATIDLSIKNPRGVFLLANYTPRGSVSAVECGGDRHTAARCQFRSPGSYDVRLFVNTEQYGRYAFAGSVEVNATP
jgi:transglutaminase-like putative cysteine protease